jgi:type IV pilus assembly protein PilA
MRSEPDGPQVALGLAIEDHCGGSSAVQHPTPRLNLMQRMRKGFTLIELLIVVVIIGILAAIAIPKFANTKQQAYLATLKEDLRNLVTAEEAYFSDYTTYTSALTTTQFNPSAGVTYTVASATGTGWSATATHVGLVGASIPGCHVAIGAAETTSSQNEGTPYCP